MRDSVGDASRKHLSPMKQVVKHSWDVDELEAIRLQNELSTRVFPHDALSPKIRLVAGVDVAYDESTNRFIAIAVLLDANSLAVVEKVVREGRTSFPYVPGLFSFRELPLLCQALEGVCESPDLVLCDSQGIAHPRRFGLASHLGVLFDVATIGCGKSCLIGEYSCIGPNRGDTSPLVDRGEVIGSVLRTQDRIKPLFVSIGHRVSLATALNWILRLAPKYRQPEPIRCANQIANQLRHVGSTMGRSFDRQNGTGERSF